MILIACKPLLRESHESGASLRQLVGDVLHDKPSVSLVPSVNNSIIISVLGGGRGGEGAWLTCDKSLMES